MGDEARAFEVIETVVDGGLDIDIVPAEGVHVAYVGKADDVVSVKLREVKLPSIGQRVKVNGRLVKVARRKFDDDGHSFLLDEGTGEWLRWA